MLQVLFFILADNKNVADVGTGEVEVAQDTIDEEMGGPGGIP